MKVINDEKQIDEVLSRSVANIFPSKEILKKELLSGRQLRIYVGIDPTATYVHLGHATNYLVLKRLHKLGHKIIVLVGDFTAMIGDPSDKTAARVRLTKDDVLHNLATFKKQIGKILDFEDADNPIEFRFNSEWLSSMNFTDLVDLGSNFTVQQMIERDVFEKRLAEKKPLYVHEFFYPLMQGYDSVALEVDLEIGGTDQTFNMLAGRTLVRRYLDKEKFVLSTTLLENPATGRKLMSKSEGTGVALSEDSVSMFSKVMALPDEALVQCFIDCTEIGLEEIDLIKKEIDSGANPRDIKMRLAGEIVKMYHGKHLAEEAEKEFVSVYQKGELPTDMPEYSITKGTILSDILVPNHIQSKSEFKRLIDQGAIFFNEHKVDLYHFAPTETGICRWSRHYIRVLVD